MKLTSAYLACLGLLFSCALCFGQEKPKPEAGAVDPALKSLSLVEAEPEFAGRFDTGATASRRLTFKNTMPVDVDVSVVEKTCGSVAAAFTPATVKPGETTTLSMSVTVAPEQPEQWQIVRFEASWTEPGGVKQTERARCGMRYASRVDYGVFPKSIVLSGVVGQDGWTHVRLSSLRGIKEPPAVTAPGCTLPGWRVEQVEADVGTGAILFKASGPVAALGMTDGEITWDTPNPARPKITVPLRVEGLSEYYAFPGGVWFTGDRGNAPKEHTVRLHARRAGAPAPASVRLNPASEVVGASLDGDSVRVEWKGDALAVGRVTAEVLAADGAVLARVPVVWYWKQ